MEWCWQEIVSETKDLIVVKTVSVLFGNIQSNMSLLFLSGIPIKDILSSTLTVWRGATAYQRDSDELFRLETLVEIGQVNNNAAEINNRIATLKDALDRNPVKELIDAGLMPTIVEDAAAEEDPYSYKSQFVETVDRVTNKLNPLVKDGARVVYMARNTAAYQGLRRITQL